MAYAFTADMTPDEMEDALIGTSAACEADPDAADKVAEVNALLPLVDEQRALERRVRHFGKRIDSRRKVANHLLDRAVMAYSKDLLILCGLDRTAPLFVTSFPGPPSDVVRAPLAAEVTQVRGWLAGAPNTALDQHRAELTRWSDVAYDCQLQEQALAEQRIAAHSARASLAAELTKRRDGLEDELAARGRELGLERDWARSFFSYR